MVATCSIIPQAEVISQRNCFKEMFLLMHKKKKKKAQKAAESRNFLMKSDLSKNFGL